MLVSNFKNTFLIQLKGRVFSRFSELNAEISIITDKLNNRKFSKGKGNRKELFDKYDKPALKPLPHESLKPYTYVIKTVSNNYHVELTIITILSPMLIINRKLY